MTRTPVPATDSAAAVPVPVRLSVLGWLTAVAAGAVEALVRMVLPDPPTPGQLAGRFAIYAVVVALVLALRTGRNAVRWALAVLLGGVGTLSLVIEPLSWLLAMARRQRSSPPPMIRRCWSPGCGWCTLSPCSRRWC